MKVQLLVERDGNNVIGNFWRVVAYEGESRLGEQIYAGYTKREAINRARQTINNEGRLS
jgi:hypothetical protein